MITAIKGVNYTLVYNLQVQKIDSTFINEKLCEPQAVIIAIGLILSRFL